MAGDESLERQQKLESEVRDMRLKEERGEDDENMDMDTIAVAPSVKKEHSTPSRDAYTMESGAVKSEFGTPVKLESKVQIAEGKPERDTIDGGVELKLEPGKAPKLARKASQKVERRPPPLFSHLEDSTDEATSTFSLMTECVYANKHIGSTEPALECDCSEEWNSATRSNDACGDDSDCINRATKMECAPDCGCGDHCQNQRFTRRQWADVSVIKTEKKGYGLRADTALPAHAFIFEYVGEVIGESAFNRRRHQYHEEGIRHFYFMSLNKGEFVDATKKGNLGRFCNHSCNPNCYVDKWVVGDKLRMGIFSERKIAAGEELVFNYNVDRYGADPQPCYCEEPNCTGFIGGRTQTERATKLSHATIEALGIEDADAWDTTVAKRSRKKRTTGEDDEEYVNHFEPRGLDEEGVNKVMSTLMQCKEKWIAVKLLARIQRVDDEKVRNRVVRFHGYRVLKTALSNFSDDVNVVLQVLDVLDKMPRLTLNKIRASKIEDTIQTFITNADGRVAAQSKALLDAWAQLELGYRIPKREPGAALIDRKTERAERRDGERRRSRSRSKSKSPERLNAPTGPRLKVAPRNNLYPNGPRPPPRFRPPPPGALPAGWFAHTAQNGSVYYYNSAGTTTWQRPTVPAVQAPPPPPSKAQTDQQMLQELIQRIVTKKEPTKQTPSGTATPSDTPQKERKEDKWRKMPEDKQKKIYESTLQPHIMHVVGKYKHKLAKDDLKRWAKELAKKIVDSDFKKGRVENPAKISDKQAKSVKKHAQDFFEKAVKKKDEADRRRADKKAVNETKTSSTPMDSPPVVASAESPMEMIDAADGVSDDEGNGASASPGYSTTESSALKRGHSEVTDLDDIQSPKKQRTESIDGDAAPPPPPPPPPPPAEFEPMDAEGAILDPVEDVSGSFTHDAIAAVHKAAFPNGTDSTEPAMDIQSSFTDGMNDDAMNEHTRLDPHFSPAPLGNGPTQVATPPTTGSPDLDEVDRAAAEQTRSSMKSAQVAQLGVHDR